MQEEANILRILKGTLKAVKREDLIELKNLSNMTIHSASISQDPDNIAVAVIVYSLSKIIERPHYRQQKGWERFYNAFIMGIEHSIEAIEKKDEKHLSKHLQDIRKKINGLSGNLKRYIQDVFNKASINKASKIYEHGISMEKTAKLLGINMWDLANYTGQRNITDYNLSRTMSVKDRIKLAMRFFE